MSKTSNTSLLSDKAPAVTKLKIPAALPHTMKHGYPLADWLAANDEARDIMIEVSRVSSTITYTALVERIVSIPITADDLRLRFLLEEISIKEDKAGRGLLSAVVVHANGDWMPGKGFFNMAARRGRDITDRTLCWTNELQFLYQYWSK